MPARTQKPRNKSVTTGIVPRGDYDFAVVPSKQLKNSPARAVPVSATYYAKVLGNVSGVIPPASGSDDAEYSRGFEVGIAGNSRPDAHLIRRWIETHVPTSQIEEMTVLASAIWDDREKAVKWLSEPNAATDNRPPIDLIGEKDGYERVKNLILRIEYGVLA